MFQPTAKVICDSVGPEGDRLTTIEVTTHRFILAEFNTHRVFSRNSASSRAIPYSKMRAKALESPALPLSWPSEQKGMQGGSELSEEAQKASEDLWLVARDAALMVTDELHAQGLHKSVINRLLEPFLPHTIIVSATNYHGFFSQRCHPDAQPEIRAAAEEMRRAYKESKPKLLGIGGWHIPYVTPEEVEEFPLTHIKSGRYLQSWEFVRENTLLQISAARCARVSYLTHDGTRDISKDVELFDKLYRHNPPHASPFEHVAVASPAPTKGNFQGWQQLRHFLGMV